MVELKEEAVDCGCEAKRFFGLGIRDLEAC